MSHDSHVRANGVCMTSLSAHVYYVIRRMMASAVRRLFSVRRWTSVTLRAVGRYNRAVAAAGSHVTSVRSWSSANTSTKGRLGLLSCVEEEVTLESQLLADLPKVTRFTATTNGCLATLEREHDGERVSVELDPHNSVEVLPDELEEGEEEEEPFFIPAFTVTITNCQGSRLQVECSFDEAGQYTERGKEWDSMSIDSVSVLPSECDSPDSVYTISAENLSAEMYDSLLDYLQTKGIDQNFAHDICQFYRVHEHRCYLQYGLKALKNFLNST